MSEPEEQPHSRRNALIALLVIAGLVLVGWWLSDILAGAARIQDCVMAGRRNCVSIR